MNALIKKGRYVVAVSGGVDSMSLLHFLTSTGNHTKNFYVVAHFNHGIRKDSKKDELLVKKTALQLGLPLEIGQGRLRSATSEAEARLARYIFLEKVRKKYAADKIMTAHHQDDLIETAVLNLIRGTGRKGISSIADNSKVYRPLIHLNKSEIQRYAINNNLVWLEDPTNKSKKYRRNLIRHQILPRASTAQRLKLIEYSKNFSLLNREIDKNIAKISHYVISTNSINRYEYVLLQSQLSKEVLLYWFRNNGIRQLNQKKINSLDNYIRTAKAGASYSITKDYRLVFSRSGETVSISR